MQAIVAHKVAHANITQVHIPLYVFGALEGLSSKTFNSKQLLFVYIYAILKIIVLYMCEMSSFP
jgi:hypothetical protein